MSLQSSREQSASGPLHGLRKADLTSSFFLRASMYSKNSVSRSLSFLGPLKVSGNLASSSRRPRSQLHQVLTPVSIVGPPPSLSIALNQSLRHRSKLRSRSSCSSRLLSTTYFSNAALRSDNVLRALYNGSVTVSRMTRSQVHSAVTPTVLSMLMNACSASACV